MTSNVKLLNKGSWVYDCKAVFPVTVKAIVNKHGYVYVDRDELFRVGFFGAPSGVLRFPFTIGSECELIVKHIRTTEQDETVCSCGRRWSNDEIGVCENV